MVHDLHESIPLLSIWTGTGPYNVNLDPSLTSEWHTLAFHEAFADIVNRAGYAQSAPAAPVGASIHGDFCFVAKRAPRGARLAPK